jgi:hypothetical protein
LMLMNLGFVVLIAFFIPLLVMMILVWEILHILLFLLLALVRRTLRTDSRTASPTKRLYVQLPVYPRGRAPRLERRTLGRSSRMRPRLIPGRPIAIIMTVSMPMKLITPFVLVLSLVLRVLLTRLMMFIPLPVMLLGYLITVTLSLSTSMFTLPPMSAAALHRVTVLLRLIPLPMDLLPRRAFCRSHTSWTWARWRHSTGRT